MTETRKKLMVPDLAQRKREGVRTMMVAAADCLMAEWAECAGIDVIGMCPHFVHSYGGFKLQGRTAEDALTIIDNAKAIEEAGAIGMEVEAVPPEVGQEVEEAVEIFTFAIGAGGASSGQLLNGADLIGSFDSFKPKFAKRFGNVGAVAIDAFSRFADEVRSGAFPDADPCYTMKPEEADRLHQALAKTS